jgi:ribonuclease-3
LQELTARLFDVAPVYAIREEGPDHEKRFFATVLVGATRWGDGEGRSKKQAEQAAAREACARLQEEHPATHA